MKTERSTVLIVDDEIDILQSLKRILERKGWSVFTAPTGELALLSAEKEKLDLVLLDIRLPDKSGIDVLKELRIKYPELPVIIITGFGYNDEIVNEAMRQGAAGYVSKNVPINELLEVINNTMTK